MSSTLSQSSQSTHEMSASPVATAPGPPSAQPSPALPASASLKPHRTRKRLSMSFTNFPIVPHSPSPTSALVSPGDPQQQQQRRSSSLSHQRSFSAAIQPQSHLLHTRLQTPTTPSAPAPSPYTSKRSLSVSGAGLTSPPTTPLDVPAAEAADHSTDMTHNFPLHNTNPFTRQGNHSSQNSESSIGSIGSSISTGPDSPSLASVNEALINAHRHRPYRSSSITKSPIPPATSSFAEVSANSNHLDIDYSNPHQQDAPPAGHDPALSTSSSTTTLVLPSSLGTPGSQPSTSASTSASSLSNPTVSTTPINTSSSSPAPLGTPQAVSRIQSPTTPSAASSAIEYYFSQLAFRERRIVELRDEIKRMQQKLKQAEVDLEEFKKQVPTSDLMPRQQQGVGQLPTSASSAGGRSQSQSRRLVIAHSPLVLVDNPSPHKTPSSAGGSGGSSNAPLSRQGSLARRQHAQPVHTPVLTHHHQHYAQGSQPTSASSSFSSRHSNSLSDSSTSSVTSSIIDPLMEADEEDCNTSAATIATPASSAHATPRKDVPVVPAVMVPPPHSTSIDNSTPFGEPPITPLHSELYPQSPTADGVYTGLYDPKYNPTAPGARPADQVLHLGKRVVEELGTQFWSFIEDIKNVTVGDDARDPLNPTAPSAMRPIGAGGHYHHHAGAHAKSHSVMVGSTSSSLRRANSAKVKSTTAADLGDLPPLPAHTLVASSSSSSAPPPPPPAEPIGFGAGRGLTSSVARSRHERGPSMRRFRSSLSMHNLHAHMDAAAAPDDAAVGGGKADLGAAKSPSENTYYIV